MTQTLMIPDDLIASIPAFLGFYPTDSLVVTAIFPKPDQPGKSLVGPITRADLADDGAVEATLLSLADIGVTVTFAFFVGEGPGGERPGIENAHMLCRRAVGHGIQVLAVWWVPEIMSGAPFRKLADNTAPEWGGNPTLRANGVLPDIATGAAMRELISGSGMLPELSREDALSFFSSVVYGDFGIGVERMTMEAEKRSAQIAEELSRSGTDQARSLLRVMVGRWLSELRASPAGDDDVGRDEEALFSVAGLLVRPEIRDLVLGIASEEHHPPALQNAMLVIARMFRGTIRCNALCVYAVTLIAAGRTARVWAALRCAYDEDSGHRLTGLLMAAYRRGRFDLILESCR
ncbi:DUF4192 domain-containing protein [Corynebacterium sp. CCM 9203]|uniref:DUF4192 domain-containing protein n=1 Tax=Corynebacterium sp. CCM 9203 TaxID=3057615 RepID=UPI003524DF3C